MIPQVQGRIDSKAFDGIELFVFHPNDPRSNQTKEALKIARDNYSFVNFETFYFVKTSDGVTRNAGFFEKHPEVKTLTQELFDYALELNDGKGNVNTHFIGSSVRKCQRLSSPYDIYVLGKKFEPYKNQITLENIIAYDLQDPENKPPVYLTGCEMSDFAEIYNKFKIPMTLDVAHLAISLKQYEKFYLKEKKFMEKFPSEFSDERLKLGKKVYEIGLKKVWLNQVSKLPIGAIKNTHFINATVTPDGNYQDGWREFDSGAGRLLDLETILSFLRVCPDLQYLVTEVADHAYTGKETDWNAVPQMVAMAKDLGTRLYRQKNN